MITVIAILVTVPFFIIMLSVRHLMGVTLRHRTVELRGVDELPAHFSSAFSEALRSLEKLGFRASHCEVSGVLFGPSDFKTWILVCVNDEQKVAASIFAPTQSESAHTCGHFSFQPRQKPGDLYLFHV